MAGWLIAAGDFVRTGGMDCANYHLARHLAAHGGVEVVTHRADPALAAMPGVRLTRVPRPLGRHILGEPLMRRRAGTRSRDVLARGGRAIANGGNCSIADINWVHYVHAAFTPVDVASPLRAAKTRLFHRKWLANERAALAVARVVVCNSRLTARHVVEHCGVAEEKTRVVRYGCDPEQLGPITAAQRFAVRAELGWPDRPTLVFIGALGDRRKGFDTLFAAMSELCRDPAWDADLAVIGRGAELPAWQQRARDAGLAERVRFLGFRNDVPRVLAACDAIVHPARYEAYGLGVHEAVCRGLPAIVSATAGVGEVLAGTLDELLLTQLEDASALADVLRRWRKNLDAVRERAVPLANRLRQRTWGVMAEEFRTAVLNAEAP
jgi:glycosyltransferase involved in cell wall biosynthesis